MPCPPSCVRAASRTLDGPELGRDPPRPEADRFAVGFLLAARLAGGRLAGALRFEAFAAEFALVVATKSR